MSRSALTIRTEHAAQVSAIETLAHVRAARKAAGLYVRSTTPDGKAHEYYPSNAAEKADFLRRVKTAGFTIHETQGKE